MAEKESSDKKHPFAEMLDDVFGPGRIDLDNYDSERAKRDKLRDEEIRQRMARLNKKEEKGKRKKKRKVYIWGTINLFAMDFASRYRQKKKKTRKEFTFFSH
eukprot:Anaeramoba_flamelloidesa339117_9.p1 GENE.a339117_9~~a339117_9.p1  ORF type:complete len:102 (+),score=28.48 a339117_9:79-384(+)